MRKNVRASGGRAVVCEVVGCCHMSQVMAGVFIVDFIPSRWYKEAKRGKIPIMRERTLKTFIRNNQQVILDKVTELENFGPIDICVLKNQIEHGIKVRERMKVITLNELTQLYIGLIAIKVVEKDRGYS